MSIKEYILNNFKNDSIEDIKIAIDESITSKDEVTLPGMGVFFSIIWENSDSSLKTQLLEIIENNLKKES